MGQLNIEHLLQATSPRSDRALVGPVRGGSGDPAFGDHLARVATPFEPPKKPDPRPATDPGATPKSNLAADERPLLKDSYNTSEASDEADTASSPVANNTENASQKDSHDQSSPATDDTEHAETTNTLEVAEGGQGNAKENNSSDDMDESETAAEVALLVNAQVIAQASKTQTVLSGEVVASQEAATDSEIAAAKSPTANREVHAATSKSDTSTAKVEILQTEQAVDTMATNAAAHNEETVVVEQDGAASHQKKDNNRTEKKGDVAKTAGQVVTQPTEGVDGKAVTTETTPKWPGEVERNSERPARSNRPSAKKDRPGVEDVSDDGANEASRNTPRTETTSGNASLAANSATAVTMPADGAKVTSTDSSVTAPQKTSKPTNSPPAGLVNSLGRLQRGGRVTSSDRSSEGNDAPQVDVARFVGRVSKAFQTAQQRGGTLQLRLSPPELGALRLELMVKDGVMTAALQTETDAARRVLLDHLPALRDRLAEQNIRIERFDVDVRREDNGGYADGRMLQQQQQQQERGSHAPTLRRAAARAAVNLEAAKAVPLPTAIGDGSGLNVVA